MINGYTQKGLKNIVLVQRLDCSYQFVSCETSKLEYALAGTVGLQCKYR